MSTKVYIIRHGEAEGNLYRRIHGQFDTPLTALGRRQLDLLERRFEGVKIDKVYSSDLVRAIETSTALTRSRGMTAVTDPALREVCLGVWEDTEWGHARHYFHDDLVTFSLDPENCYIEGGEKFSQVQERMVNAVRRMAAENDGGTIAIFSHGGATRDLIAYIKNIPSNRMAEIPHCDNTAVMELRVDNGEIEIISDFESSHLTEEYTRFVSQGWHNPVDGLDISNLRMEKAGEDQKEMIETWCGKSIEILPQGTFIAFRGEEPIGAVSVDVSDKSAGRIGIYIIKSEWRGNCYSAQLLGLAVSQCRKAGIDRLQAEFESGSTAALSLLHLGFEKKDVKDGKTLLEMRI